MVIAGRAKGIRDWLEWRTNERSWGKENVLNLDCGDGYMVIYMSDITLDCL